MNIIREIKIEPTGNVSVVFVAEDPSAVGLDLGVGSIATIIGGALGGNTYRKDDVLDTDWTLILDANPA